MHPSPAPTACFHVQGPSPAVNSPPVGGVREVPTLHLHQVRWPLPLQWHVHTLCRSSISADPTSRIPFLLHSAPRFFFLEGTLEQAIFS